MAFDHLVLVLQIILFVFPVNARVPKLQCQYSCGDVYVFYPFGIGEGCYFNKWFEVSCDNTTGSPRAFLTSLHLEISYDPYSNGLSEVGLHYYLSQRAVVNIDQDYLQGKKNKISHSGSPFSFSTMYNMLVAFGCENHANISVVTTNLCKSFCTCDPSKQRGCCDFLCILSSNHSSIGRNKIPIHLDLKECRKPAVMVDQKWLLNNYVTNHSAVSKNVLPVSLEWGRKKGRCVELFNPSNTFCNIDKFCLIQLNDGDYYCLCDDQQSQGDQGCTGTHSPNIILGQ